MRQAKRTGRSDDGNAFLPESAAHTGAKDDLAELMAESHQAAVITGEDLDDESHDEQAVEEIGGPFILSDPGQEFGETRKEPYDASYEQSSLPEAVGGLGVASPEEQVEASETESEAGDEEPAPDAEDESPSRLDPKGKAAQTGAHRR